MLNLALALLLTQTPAVRRSTPAVDDPGMVVRQAGTASVTCTNCQTAFTPDGGSIGSVTQGRALDGGTGWGVYIEGGTLSVSSSTTFDGGSIGYLRMPDGGALEVYTVNAGSSGGGWVPDGGFVGLVGLADGGGVFVTNTSLVVTGPLTDAQLRASAVPVSVSTLPLPSGAATEATLGTRAADSTITARLNTLGQKTAANSAPMVLASDQTAIPVTDNGGSLTVDGTVSVSGTVTTAGTTTAAQGTPAATANRWPVQLTDGTDLAQVSASGAVLVDGSGVTQPVSGSVTVTQATGTNLHVVVDTAPTTTVTGTVTANAGTGPWPVTDNGSSLTVDGTVAATQSGAWNITNISGTVSLPTGAATETTLGTRLAESTFTGRFPASASLADTTANPSLTASASYLMGYNGTTWDRLRKSASGLLVDIQNTSLAVTQSGAWNVGQSGTWTVGLSAGTNYIGKTRVTDGTLDVSLLNSAPGSDTGQVAVPVRIISSLAGGAGGTSSSYGSAFPASGTAAGFSDGTNMQGARVFDLDSGGGTQYGLGVNLRVAASGGSTEAAVGAGATSASTLRVVLPTDQTSIPVTDNGGSLTVDGTVSASLNAGTNYVGKVRQTDGTLDLSLLNAAPGSDTGQVSIPVRVISSLAGGAGGTSSSYGSAFPASGTAAGFNDGTNMSSARTFDADTGGGTQNVLGVNLRVGASGGSAEAAAGAGATSASTLRVVLPTDQTAIPVSDNGGSLTVDGTVALSGTSAVNVSQVGGTSVTTGSGTVGAGTQRVVLATDQSVVPVNDNGGSLTVDGTVAATQSGTWNITNVSGTVSLPTGAATAANQTTLGSQTTKLNDGTDTALISAAGALLVDGSATTQPVSGTVGVSGTVTVSGTVDTELPAAAALADATANPTITSAGSLNLLFNGTTWDRMRGDTTNGLLVNVSDSFLLDATFTGRFAAGAALSDNFANPTTTQTGAMNMLWDGATWDRAPGTSTDGMLVNLGANNDVTVTGTVTANAGTGNFATNLAQYGGVAVSAANALHVQPGTGASFTVAQSTASNLRAQTASEGTVGSAVPSSAALLGASDGTNLRAPKVFDLDASATTPDWVLGTQLRVGAWGASQPVSYAQSSWGNIDIAVYSDPKLSATPTTTAVTCATTATAAPASLLSSRTTVTFVNNSAVTIYIGGSAVTTANGIPLLPGASFTDDVSAAPYYCRVASGTADLRVLEN